MAPIYELWQNLLLSGAALLAFAFLLGVITRRDIVSHLRILTASSRRIAGRTCPTR